MKLFDKVQSIYKEASFENPDIKVRVGRKFDIKGRAFGDLGVEMIVKLSYDGEEYHVPIVLRTDDFQFHNAGFHAQKYDISNVVIFGKIEDIQDYSEGEIISFYLYKDGTITIDVAGSLSDTIKRITLFENNHINIDIFKSGEFQYRKSMSDNGQDYISFIKMWLNVMKMTIDDPDWNILSV